MRTSILRIGIAFLSAEMLLFANLVVCAQQIPSVPPDKPQKPQPIRVLIASPYNSPMPIAQRLKKLNFDVRVVSMQEVDPDRFELVDVLFLPTQWADQVENYDYFESKKKAFHAFVKRGGGLLVCQPNPPTVRDSYCTPSILPYPVTFKNWYDTSDPRRKNLDPTHFITEDLPGSAMPFPADPIVEIDEQYTVLARQISTDSPSLAVCPFGKGRVVIQTANENSHATIPLTDEILRRMVVWAAHRELVGKKK